VAIAALLLWMCTAGVGGYLLVTSTRVGGAGQRHDPGAPVPASQPVPPSQPVRAPAQAAPGTAQAATPPRARDRFDPPSLARAKSEPLPGMRELAEFTHPAPARERAFLLAPPAHPARRGRGSHAADCRGDRRPRLARPYPRVSACHLG
jgi:hypothetical protein